MLTADPLIPAGLWLTMSIAGAVLLVVYGWRRPGGITRGRWRAILTLMGTALALVLLLLLNFTWELPLPPPPGKPRLTVLVDASASMGTRDVGNGSNAARSRYESAAELAQKVEAAAGPGVELRIRRFDEKAQAVGLADLAKTPPTGDVTDIAGAIADSLEPDFPQGQAIMVLTDGIQSEGAGGAAKVRAAAQASRAAGAAVYGVVLGGQGGGLDVAVEAHSSGELSFVQQKVILSADLRARGYTGPVTVRLLADGKELERQQVTLAGKPVTVRFEVARDKPGLYPYEMQVEPAPGTAELTTANNSALCLLRVVDKPVRLTLLEGKPYWDSKFLIRQLATDASLELHSLVQVAPGRVLERRVTRPGATADPAADAAATNDQWNVLREPEKFLSDAGALRDCQILVLGRDTDEFLTGAAVVNLQRWISRDGGVLICYRGSPEAQMDPGLARLFPVKWQPSHEARFQLTLTDLGRNLDWFGGQEDGGALAALPALASDTQIEQTRPLAVVVAEAQWPGRNQSPAVTYQPYGAGRVVVIEGAGMWRWAFPPTSSQSDAPAGRAGESGTDQVYASVWHALFRWVISGAGLAPGEEAAIRPDKVAFAAREPAAATVLLRNAGAGPANGNAVGGPAALTVQVEGAGASKSFPCEPSPEDPSTFRVQFGVLPPGRYTATLKGAAASAVFDVRKFGEEELNLTARPDVLQMLATDSGGAVLQPSDASSVATLMKQKLEAGRRQRVSFATAWDRLGVFVAVLALWASAWALRRSSGLI